MQLLHTRLGMFSSSFCAASSSSLICLATSSLQHTGTREAQHTPGGSKPVAVGVVQVAVADAKQALLGCSWQP
jgi:hypothetical protein